MQQEKSKANDFGKKRVQALTEQQNCSNGWMCPILVMCMGSSRKSGPLADYVESSFSNEWQDTANA